MATDPRHNVRPGDKLRIAAEQINWINRQMRADTGFKSGSLEGYEPGRNIILARNNTGADLPRWGVMRISGIEVNPATDDKGRRSFEEMPCITGAKPNTTTGGKFVIAVEPIKSGKIGRVSAAGIVQAKVSFSDAGHTRAKPKDDTVDHLESAVDGPAEILWSAGTSGEQWALVRFDEAGGGGQIRVGKVSADWAFGTCADVTVWERVETGCVPISCSGSGVAIGNGELSGVEQPIGNGGPCEETIDDVANLSHDVAANSWVVIGQAANGRWYLLDAGKNPGEGSCRQTIGGEDITKWPGWNGSIVQLLGHDENGCLKWFDGDECSPPSPGTP